MCNLWQRRGGEAQTYLVYGAARRWRGVGPRERARERERERERENDKKIYLYLTLFICAHLRTRKVRQKTGLVFLRIKSIKPKSGVEMRRKKKLA